MDCSPLGSSVHGILQAKWVSISSSRVIFPTQGSNLCLLHRRRTLYRWATCKAQWGRQRAIKRRWEEAGIRREKLGKEGLKAGWWGRWAIWLTATPISRCVWRGGSSRWKDKNKDRGPACPTAEPWAWRAGVLQPFLAEVAQSAPPALTSDSCCDECCLPSQ